MQQLYSVDVAISSLLEHVIIHKSVGMNCFVPLYDAAGILDYKVAG
jgi:hypothetical protein